MSSRNIDVVARVREIADQIERDRREPDKVLCAIQNLRRLATDVENGVIAFIKPTEADLERGRQLAKEHGW